MKKFSILFITCVMGLLIDNQATAQSWNLTGNSNATTSSKLGTTNGSPLVVYTKNVERLRIDSNGKMGIGWQKSFSLLSVKANGGTPTSSKWLTSGSSPVFYGFAESGNSELNLGLASGTSTTKPLFITKRSRGNLSSPSVVSNNDFLSTYAAAGYDGSAFQTGAAIDMNVDGTAASGKVPARIVFATGTNSTDREERLRIASNGNVSVNNSQLFVNKSNGRIGIGTTSPASKVDIKGTGTWDLSVTEGDFRIGDATYRLKMGVANAGGGAGDAYIASSHRLYLGAGKTVARIQTLCVNSNGTVGVGTYTPAAKFQVQNDSSNTALNATVSYTGSRDVIAIQSMSKPADGYGYGIQSTGGYMGGYFTATSGAYTGSSYGVYAYATGTAGYHYGVYGSASGGTDNWGGYFPTKTYASELRVGGTRGATGYVAAINGRLIATEVRVELLSNWPDYVFGGNHKLLSIDELEASIKKDKHLPGVPSASQVKENGIMLGEMQTKTMEKVEENTLYIIALNNKIKELEKIIEELARKTK